ncbi:hypothetical protein TIFTF001_013981 [Ficus carica]|uniref:Uncharacterized protein n=1 Tax=Ficus carica TaxID=3494 RepID=A0AA88D7S0_FICCA|nr:hypothetical protein TIFTF001_013981 [Ficus carica]
MASTKGHSMLKSTIPASLGARVTLVGRIPSGLGEKTCSECTDIGPPLNECHVVEAGTMAGIRYSDRFRTLGAVPADHPKGGSVVVQEVLPEPIPWVPTVVCSRSLNEC